LLFQTQKRFFALEQTQPKPIPFFSQSASTKRRSATLSSKSNLPFALKQ
jgi:hypothetical protein